MARFKLPFNVTSAAALVLCFGIGGIQPANADIICNGNCTTDPLRVGSDSGGAGSLEVNGGSVVLTSTGGAVGSFGPDRGELTIDGIGSRVEINSASGADSLFIGSFGNNAQADVLLRNGGELVLRDNSGLDADNQGVFVGNGGVAFVDIGSGARLAIEGDAGPDDPLLNQTFINVGYSAGGGRRNHQRVR